VEQALRSAVNDEALGCSQTAFDLLQVEVRHLPQENEALRQRLQAYEAEEFDIEAHQARWGHLRRVPLTK